MLVKLMNVKFGLKTYGEKKIVMLIIHKSSVPVHLF
jgi:hypothetical protein